MDNQPYILTELEDLSTIFTPLKSTTRIKYTCFNASNSFLVFGATSGGLYVFQREPCCFLQLLPNKEGAVTQVSISPDEKLIAFSTVRGNLCILEKTQHSSRRVLTTGEHQNDQVTSLQWNDASNELFVGDSTGKVSIVSLSLFPAKGMFQTPTFVLMQLDSKIVQMDFSSNMLLVSTLTKCYICDTKKEMFRQVGQKLRDGEFGACMLKAQTDKVKDLNRTGSDLPNVKLYCARPGSRVWECSLDGTVISTHHFKEALAVPPRKIHFLRAVSSQNGDVANNGLHTNGSSTTTATTITSDDDNNDQQTKQSHPEQSFNFQKLHSFMSNFLFTFKSDGLYFFDPEKAVVVLWNNEITNIVDARAANDVVYVWSGYGKMYALNLVPLEKFLINLYFQKRYVELARKCVEFRSCLMSNPNNFTKLYVLQDLDEKLRAVEGGLEGVSDALQPLINMCKANAEKRKVLNAQILKSGLYFLARHEPTVNGQKLIRPGCLNLKGRSHSVSPDRLQNGGPRYHGSTSSLPDLVIKGGTSEDSSNGEIVAAGTGRKRSKETPSPTGEEDGRKAEGIAKIVGSIAESHDPPDELVRSLFDGLLDLAPSRDLSQVESLPFDRYFNPGEIGLMSDLFQSRLASRWILDWLSKIDGDWLDEAVKEYPVALREQHSPANLKLDVKLSRLLKFLSGILKETEIVESVRRTKMECYYRSLVEILGVYSETSLTSVSESTLNLANVSSTTKILNIAYFLISVGQVDQCSKYSQTLDLTEFFYLMLKFEESSKRLGKPVEMVELQCHTLFLSYLDRAANTGALVEKCGDPVERYIVTCLENLTSAASCFREVSCSCGFPCSTLQPALAMSPNVGQALVRKTWPAFQDRCIDLCRRVPYLWKYLISIRRSEPLDSVLPLILQSGEVQELETRANDVTPEVLESAVRHLIRLKAGRCLNCDREIKSEGDTVSWSELGMLSVKLSSPETTLALFQKYSGDIGSKELTQTFYQSLIFSAIMERHSAGLRREVVDALTGRHGDASGRIPVMSDRVRRKVFGDVGGLGDDGSGDHGDQDHHHWGVRVNFNEGCRVCSLPLNTKVLISESGLIAFKCAHAFHSACLRKTSTECPVCESSKSKD